jgi:hypothetical protein
MCSKLLSASHSAWAIINLGPILFQLHSHHVPSPVLFWSKCQVVHHFTYKYLSKKCWQVPCDAGNAWF